jgi:hypothetical protein
MRSTLFIVAGVAALGLAAPASAAQLHIGTDEGGVSVGVGPDHRRHGRDYRAYDDSYARGSCREVRSKTYRPDGRVVYRTKRVCD